MNLPKVSIVTPSYNQAEFLERTILSVLNQDYPNIEYIIMDGGSIDGSVEIIKKYENKLAYWVSETDKGQSNAINKGFSKATGDIYCYLNSDDILTPSAVKIAVHYLSKMPEVGLVYADRVIINKHDQITGYMRYRSHNPVFFKFINLFAQETGFFRSDLWKKSGGVDENLYYSMDKDLWFKYMLYAKLYHIPFVLGAYRWHSSAKIILTKKDSELLKRNEEENRIITQRYLNFFYRMEILRRCFSYLNRLNLWYENHTKKYKREVNKIIDLIE